MLKLTLKLRMCFILVFLCWLTAFGQKDSSKTKFYPFIQLNGGVRNPLGHFFLNPTINSINNPGFQYVGQAVTGYTINLSFSYPIMKSHWGAIAKSDYGANNFDISELFSDKSPQIAGNYEEFSAIGGVFFSLPVKNVLLDFKFLTGLIFFKYPGLIYSETNYTSPNNGAFSGTWNVAAGNTTAVEYNIGIGMRYLISRNLIFSGNIDIYRSKKKSAITQNIQYTDNFTGIESNEVNICSLAVKMLDISIGLGYKIGR